jgi:16S rRNA (cytosine1402-N4)-methyltransferase
MMQVPNSSAPHGRHIPVLLKEVVAALAPQDGETFIDGTFGAGGYARALLETANCRILAIDQDPAAIADAEDLVRHFAGRLVLRRGKFSALDNIANDEGVPAADGVVLDIGVSSMQIDDAERGFSFQKDGPLDMRMSRQGPSAADVVNNLTATELADLIFKYGEEARSRAIARAIVKARSEAPVLTTLQLVAAISPATGPHRHGARFHPATRTFQALRIYVNRELEELEGGLAAAERLLRAGGRLAVVTFHSLEDRIVKRFLAERSGHVPGSSRHMPERKDVRAPSFELLFKGHVEASQTEINTNPRARSAKLRAARRTSAPAFPPAAAKERA